MRALAIALLVSLERGGDGAGANLPGVRRGSILASRPRLLELGRAKSRRVSRAATRSTASRAPTWLSHFRAAGRDRHRRRSASCAGCVQNGWLDRVKYVTAVSGGSWAAVPFTYYPGERLSDLLGTFDADLKKIDLVDIEERPNGSLALQVTKSGLAASGVEEAFQFLPDQKQGEIDLARIRSVGTMLRDGIRKVRGRDLPDASRQNKTYSHILGQIFIDPLVKDGNRMPYGWTRNAVLDITEVSHQPQMDFQQVPDKRPFLIVGGTIVWMRPGFVYPRLIPIEYTPLYTGVRQQFGNLGGTYVMPWAYDREHVLVSGDRLLVDPAKVRMFTLADVIASSGAAPQLKLMLGESLPERARGPAMQAAGAFPSFRPFAIRDGQFVAPGGELAHGDGGFTDNLGLMPLLARQVRHVIAFVNSNKTYTQNEQLQSYFFPLSTQSGSGDKTMNAVFPKAKYRELLDGLDEVTKAGGPAIFCQTMTVTRNELYNIAGYDGLRVCWVYNYAANDWREALPDQLKTWLGDPKNGGRKDLQRFPVLRDLRGEQALRDQAQRAAGESAGESRRVVDHQRRREGANPRRVWAGCIPGDNRPSLITG